MIDVQNYVVTREIALRTGDIRFKYRTEDGRFIVDNRTLAKIRFTSDEIVNGLDGVEKITEEEAKTLIARGGYKMGDIEEDSDITESVEKTLNEPDNKEEETEKEEETKEEEE